MPRDTIVLVSTYEHPSRDSIERMLRETFAEYQLENISTFDIIKSRKDWIVPNLYYIAKEYGLDVLRGRSSAKARYFQTTYLFKQLREAMRGFIDPSRHLFSIATQSKYDISVTGVPHFIYTDHTHLSNLSSPYFDRSRLLPQRWLDLERTVYHNAQRVFTRSSNVTADVVRLYGVEPEKVVCVYAGSNVEAPHDYALDNEGYANRRILFVGDDWDRKGGPELLTAFEEVRQTYPDARLTIASAGAPAVNLPGVDVLGRVPLDQLMRHYSQSSIFCLPTRLEPFGIVFLEAMMWRLPIVATSVGAVPDMVEEGLNGHLVIPGDPKALARALIELIGNPELCRRYGEAGHRRVLDRYTWDQVGRRMREQILPFIRQD